MTEYLNGYIIKPAKINALGIVEFTDGTNAVTPNQQQCQAYGYTYDKITGTCKAFNYNTNLERNISNVNNNIQGAGNVTGTGTNNTYIMGEDNTVQGLSTNNIIIGNENVISSGVKNAAVFGNFGIAERTGEVVIGGGGFSGAGKGYAQSSVITLTGTTTDETVTSLFVNGDSSVTTIARGSGTVYTGFDVSLLGVRTGGTAGGSEGDRIFLKRTGIILEAVSNESSATIDEFGTVTGWTGTIAFSGANMVFQVTGVADMDISWSCTLNLYEMKV